MTFGRLLWRNLWFHWRGNLAVLLGVIVGAAVLTGALLVGDSLRGSRRTCRVCEHHHRAAKSAARHARADASW